MLLSGRFCYRYGRPGDSFCVRETPGLSGRVGMYVLVYLSPIYWWEIIAINEHRSYHVHK